MKAILVLTIILVTACLATCEKKPVADTKDEKIATEPVAEENTNGDFDLIQVMVQCNDSFRVEMSYLETLNKSGSFPDEGDKTPKCYIRCVLENSGVATDEGNSLQFNTTRAAEIFSMIRGSVPLDDLKDIADKCSDRDESCKCEKAYQFLKCLFENEIDKYEKST